MTSLTKIEVKDDDNQTVYITYKLPDISTYTKWLGQGKILLDEIEREIPNINDQSKTLFDKQIELQAKLDKMAYSYEEKLKQSNFELDSKIKEILKLKNNLNRLEKVKNDSKKLNEELINDLERAKEEIIQLKKNQNEVELVEDVDIEKIKQRRLKLASVSNLINHNPKINVNKITSNSNTNNTVINTNNTAIEIEMKTSIPTFNGRSNANPNIGDWLFQCKKILDLAYYSESQMVVISTNHLKELAQQDYILHEKTHGIHKTWSDFSEYMIKLYTPTNNNQIIRSKLTSLYQITSINDYYNEFRNIALQATDMNEPERLNAFINGMKPDIMKYVRMQLPKSLETAFEAANLYETYNYESIDAIYISNQAKVKQNKPDYDIIFSQQVGNHYRYELKFKDGSTKWVPEHEVDPNIIKNFLNSENNTYKNYHNQNNNYCDNYNNHDQNNDHNYDYYNDTDQYYNYSDSETN